MPKIKSSHMPKRPEPMK